MQFKYVCEKCGYKGNNKTNYTQHLQTKKHNATICLHNATKIMQHKCCCGRVYKQRQSLYRHKKYCDVSNPSNDIIVQKNVQNEMITDILKEVKYDNKAINITVNYNNNNIIENIQNKANTIQNNNTFSVKNYLNNECKDAYTVQQVLDNFQCDIMKLPSQPVQFYKDIVDKAFHNIPPEKLPIRCSDMKRKTFYGNAPVWNKDFDVVKGFMMKLVDTICDFRKMFSRNNPEWYDNDITSDIMNSIIINIAKIYDEKTVKHIINYISERTKIDK